LFGKAKQTTNTKTETKTKETKEHRSAMGIRKTLAGVVLAHLLLLKETNAVACEVSVTGGDYAGTYDSSCSTANGVDFSAECTSADDAVLRYYESSGGTCNGTSTMVWVSSESETNEHLDGTLSHTCNANCSFASIDQCGLTIQDATYPNQSIFFADNKCEYQSMVACGDAQNEYLWVLHFDNNDDSSDSECTNSSELYGYSIIYDKNISDTSDTAYIANVSCFDEDVDSACNTLDNSAASSALSSCGAWIDHDWDIPAIHHSYPIFAMSGKCFSGYMVTCDGSEATFWSFENLDCTGYAENITLSSDPNDKTAIHFYASNETTTTSMPTTTTAWKQAPLI
jgi:hypothetical protein